MSGWTFFFFKQKTAYEMLRSLVGSEMCIRDRCSTNGRDPSPPPWRRPGAGVAGGQSPHCRSAFRCPVKVERRDRFGRSLDLQRRLRQTAREIPAVAILPDRGDRWGHAPECLGRAKYSRDWRI